MKVRFLTNVELECTSPKGKSRIGCKSGHYKTVIEASLYPDGYVDLYFNDGSVAKDVAVEVLEFYEGKPKKANRPKVKPRVEDVKPVEKDIDGSAEDL